MVALSCDDFINQVLPHMGVPGGGRGGWQIVGQAKPVGQFSLPSRVNDCRRLGLIRVYYKKQTGEFSFNIAHL